MPSRVAVIIPCFNDGELLVEAIDSISEGEPVETVVVDDATTDVLALRLLAELGEQVTVVRHEQNCGPAEARNTGLRSTGARYVFPLDADDLAVPRALATLADRLDAWPSASFAFGDYEEFGTHELIRAVPTQLDPYRIALRNEYPPSALFRREVLNAVGGWRQMPGHGYEDWDLWMALAERGLHGVHMGPGFLTYRRRLHGPRMLNSAKRKHVALYRDMRAHHPLLFRDLPKNRAASDLGTIRKLLYPVLYGGRRRYGFESAVNRVLDRLGIWTLRR